MNETTTSNEFTPEQLRAAVAALMDPEKHGLDGGFATIPKALAGALFESAFPAPSRGLVYADEMVDLGAYLATIATLHTEQCRYAILLATGAAWAAEYVDDDDGETPSDERKAALRALVRSIAAFFFRCQVMTAADVLSWGRDEGGAA